MEQTKQSVITRVQDYVEHFLNEKLPDNREYHDTEHTKRVVEAAVEIGKAEHLSTDDIEVLKIAA